MVKIIRIMAVFISIVLFFANPCLCGELKITYRALSEDAIGASPDFPKYTTQLINLANQNAHATRPKIVGQMSELIQEFNGNGYEEWVRWYKRKHPESIDEATERISKMLENLKAALSSIDKEMVRLWVEDLVLTKTFVGLYAQESILKRIAEQKGVSYRLATPAEESKGIDGMIGERPVSVKPESYRAKPMLPESIKVDLIYYKKVRGGIKVRYDF